MWAFSEPAPGNPAEEEQGKEEEPTARKGADMLDPAMDHSWSQPWFFTKIGWIILFACMALVAYVTNRITRALSSITQTVTVNVMRSSGEFVRVAGSRLGGLVVQRDAQHARETELLARVRALEAEDAV